MKNNTINIRVSDELKKKAEKKAKLENRSLSNYLEMLIKIDVNEEN